MKVISTVICTLVILVHHYNAEETPSYNLEYMDIKSTSNTKDYVDPVEVLIEKDGPKSTFTIKSTVKKEIPMDAICETNFYKKEDGEFKTVTFTIGPTPCCDLYKYGVFKRIIDTQNVPKVCPFVPGEYSVDKYSFDTNRYKDISPGEYLTKFTATLPADKESIFYGIDLYFKIADAA